MSEERVTTTEELDAWIAAEKLRHSELQAGAACSCGWTSSDPSDLRWVHHAEVAVVSALGDVLASDTWVSDQDGSRVESWRECVGGWTEGFDRAHEVQDAFEDALLAIARGHDRPREFAAAVLCRIYPRSSSAEDLRAAGVEIDAELACGYPADA